MRAGRERRPPEPLHARAGGTAPRPRRRPPRSRSRRRRRPRSSYVLCPSGSSLDHRSTSAASTTYGSSPGGRRLVPLADRARRSPPAPPARLEVLDADVVREQARDAALEAIELRPGVLADREQEVHAQVGLVDESRELDRERAVAVLVLVVEEVLLELVEDDEERAHALGPAAERRDRSALARPPGPQIVPAAASAAAAPIAAISAGQRIVTPGAEHADRKRRASAASPRPRRGSARRRSWTTPAWSSEVLPTPLGPYTIVSRVARRFAATMRFSSSRPKKKVGVLLVVGDETDVRRLRRRRASRGDAASRRPWRRRAQCLEPSRSTYSLSGEVDQVDVAAAVSRAASRSRARAGPVGSSCTAHDFRSSCSAPQIRLQDHAQVPVAHRVAEEEEVARRPSEPSSSVGICAPSSPPAR